MIARSTGPHGLCICPRVAPTPGAGPAVVIGNGPSRLTFDLDILRNMPVATMGCNALYRDHPWVDLFGCIDNGISCELAANVERARIVHQYRYDEWETARGPNNTSRRRFKSRPFSCGPMMVSYAADAGHSPIYLVGFDFDRRGVYQGTANYEDPPSPTTLDDPVREWIEQVFRIIGEHPGKSFYWITPTVAEAADNKIGRTLRECGYPVLDALSWEHMLATLGIAWDKGAK